MPGYIVFVRFFLGYTESFPFDRFLSLKDAEINGELENLCREWLSDPANVARLQASRLESEEWKRKWYEYAQMEDTAPEPQRTGEPRFEEIASEARWWDSTTCGDLKYGISHRFPVRRYKTKEIAEAAGEVLQKAMSDLARSIYIKQDWDSEEHWFATVNPRFFVLPEQELSRAELMGVEDGICRLTDPVGKYPTPEEAFLRSILPKIRGMLEKIDALPTPEDMVADPGDSHVMASAASKTNSADVTEGVEPLEKEPPCYDQRLRHGHPEAADTLAEALARRLRADAGSDQERNERAIEAGAACEPLKALSTQDKKPKRSTVPREGREKLIAALTRHHQYAKESCLNSEPIGNNELARQAKVSPSTASEFFSREFGDWDQYRAMCMRKSAELGSALKLLNGEFAPRLLYERIPPGEGQRSEDE